ncbi:Low-affinity zinc transporter of the plasma membrane [Ascoidea rubescens DSM 1968]|uniref:Low-affinity zinc transporter of the plasma membrane n=1 Tax=Ascoidea rubescens DSM 1968 TaxID=1344418 RepID=A0A1D2VN64_9ASCO|nr:Low-affinity zinc transporter of the plasma membrane [Ascoidea rubescens DSM 1968]ODV63061.1 Low-affinity zinc transporter of the plasma membrane [Ascoidea rubescens DSM 1968]
MSSFSDVFFGGEGDECATTNDYNGEHWNARISTVPVLLVTSLFGAVFPVMSANTKHSWIKMPDWCFFYCKYFGSGVILATTFIHLLDPGIACLADECLGGVWNEYPMGLAVSLISLCIIFLVEILIYYFLKAHNKALNEFEHDAEASSDYKTDAIQKIDSKTSLEKQLGKMGHNHGGEVGATTVDEKTLYSGQLVTIFVLEFGIIFHSVFVGLSLTTSGDEFTTLYVVIVFHQFFEGLGLGARIACTKWPENRKLTPYLLAVAYGLTTPISASIGLGVRKSYVPGSRTALIVTGMCDSMSAGVLLYSSLVELMAQEFLYSNEFDDSVPGKRDGLKKLIGAYILFITGAALMACLGKWA